MNDATQPQDTPKVEAQSDPFHEFQKRLAPQLEQAQAQLEGFNQRAKAFIKKNPGTTLLGAAALGFLVGRWASRR